MDGEWNAWTGWSACSVTCGSGRETRTRHCNNPAPEYGGKMCPGNTTESKSCYPAYCSGMGNFTFPRHSPRFFFYLRPYLYLLKHYVVYIVMKEGIKFVWSVDGGWSVWQTWGRCSVTCGNGVRNRARSCNNPVPQYGGNQCTGDATEIHFCHERSCPGVFYFDITRSCFCHGTYLLNTNVKVVTDWSSWMYHWTKC